MIDKLIVLVANSLSHGAPEEHVLEALKSQENPDLIFIAGKLLCQDRMNAPPKKTLIRRTQ